MKLRIMLLALFLAGDMGQAFVQPAGRNPTWHSATSTRTIYPPMLRSRTSLLSAAPGATERIVSAEELELNEHWIVIRGRVYDVGGYLARHPGGRKAIEKYFKGGDATHAFDAVKHSNSAHRFLDTLKVGRIDTSAQETLHVEESERGTSTLGKFFTHEDRYQVHKIFGLYVLLHYVYRHVRLFAGHPSAGFDGSWISLLTILPHALLSSSSFIFHIPRERVAERPMIWQEFRAHNVCFALRSVLAFVLLWSVEHAEACGASSTSLVVWRALAVCGSAATAISAMRVADAATNMLRVDSRESTTATMPYWRGCSAQTEARHKAFYAYCQIMATGGCLSVFNLSWPFAIMLPIQLASLLMTCVRKGALSARGYHLIYTGSLIVPFFVGLRTAPLLFSILALGGVALFYIRRLLPRGAKRSKYMLWAPVAAARIALFARSGI